jgi:hypothetical protein
MGGGSSTRHDIQYGAPASPQWIEDIKNVVSHNPVTSMNRQLRQTMIDIASPSGGASKGSSRRIKRAAGSSLRASPNPVKKRRIFRASALRPHHSGGGLRAKSASVHAKDVPWLWNNHEWTLATDEGGNAYYFNVHSNESSWDPPDTLQVTYEPLTCVVVPEGAIAGQVFVSSVNGGHEVLVRIFDPYFTNEKITHFYST